MPRTRSSPAPRSVRHLTHQPKRLAKKLKAEPVVSEETPIAAGPEVYESEHQRLIRHHAAVRAERHRSSLGFGGILAVVVTCGVIFVGWWFLPNSFEPKEQRLPLAVPPIVPSATSTRPVPVIEIAPSAATSSIIIPTSTQRRLLIPLNASSSPSIR